MLTLTLQFVFALVVWVVCYYYLIPLVGIWLAKNNWFFTIVEEATAKAVMYNGKFSHMLLSKKGYKLDRDGNIVKLRAGEKDRSSGLRWIGVPPFYTIHSRTMRFTKALPQAGADGNLYQVRADPNTDFILAYQDYQYALVFNDAEDADYLPLSGLLTMTARIINPEKALFAVGDWFDALVSRVLPDVREFISNHKYGKIIHDTEVQLDEEVFKALTDSGKIESLKVEYGIELVALEVVNIDPPADYREQTLAKWSAQQRAMAESEETGGALALMVDRQIKAMEEHTELTPADKKQIRVECLDLLRRDRAGKSGGLKDIRLAHADGTPFANGSISQIVAGIVAAVASSSMSRDDGGNPGGRSSRHSGGGERRGRRNKPSTPAKKGKDDTSQEEDDISRLEESDEEN